jgi:hypothetical protein
VRKPYALSSNYPEEPVSTTSAPDEATEKNLSLEQRVKLAQERAAREQKEAAGRQLAALSQTLQDQINGADLTGAYFTARQVLRLDPGHKEAWDFKCYLEREQPDSLPKEWTYMLNRQQHGPVSDLQLKQLLLTRQLPAKVPVWRAGMATWVRACQVNDLFADEGRQTCPWCVEDWLDAASDHLYACRSCENFFFISRADLPIPEDQAARSKWAHAHHVTVYRCGGCSNLVYVPEGIRQSVTCPHCQKKRKYWGHGIFVDDGIKGPNDSGFVFFQCPKCSTRLHAAQDDGSMIVMCPPCKHYIEVPSVGWLGRWASEKARPAIMQYRCRHCMSVIDPNADRCSHCGKFQAQCQYCLMDVPRFARACHHCTRALW